MVADPIFSGSKSRSCCGHRLESLPILARRWSCPACGAEQHREVDAPVNRKDLAVSSTVSAPGGEGSGLGRKARTKPASMKREACFFPI
uniref:zinc ribbon domain-containing protein n=1 Tax=Candidatus Methylacidiphilum infernorum TaxID=511746 RepID=UPI001930E1CA